MNDHDFLQAFEASSLHPFPHHDHIRMAWLYLRAHKWDEAATKIRAGIQRLAQAHGATRKYHETITLFWARVVAEAIKSTPDITDFEVFTAHHPQLFDSRYVEQFYSRDVLFSEQARHAWVEPDVVALPAQSI
jgi:hypothetical protein